MKSSLIFSVVCVGGDGTFSEVVHGLLTRMLRASGVHEPAIDTDLPRPRWRVGIIPAGKVRVKHKMWKSNQIKIVYFHLNIEV